MEKIEFSPFNYNDKFLYYAINLINKNIDISYDLEYL